MPSLLFPIFPKIYYLPKTGGKVSLFSIALLDNTENPEISHFYLPDLCIDAAHHRIYTIS